MDCRITHLCPCADEHFNCPVVQTCFSLVGYIVVYISNRAVGVSNDQDMRNKRRLSIIGEQDCLQRSINNNILRNIEEYTAVPQCRMQRSN
ncbi:hypothetical protein D3C75_774000 [compost metagenome]